MPKWKHFSEEEVSGLNLDLVAMLDLAREICGFPFKITSGLRTPEKNAAVGGVEDSSHIKGLAVDLAAPIEAGLREKMAWSLGLAGFKRIGSYERHFHVDIDAWKDQYVMWFGKSK